METMRNNKNLALAIERDNTYCHKKFRKLRKVCRKSADHESTVCNADLTTKEEIIDVEAYSNDEAEEPAAKRKCGPSLFRPWEVRPKRAAIFLTPPPTTPTQSHTSILQNTSPIQLITGYTASWGRCLPTQLLQTNLNDVPMQWRQPFHYSAVFCATTTPPNSIEAPTMSLLHRNTAPLTYCVSPNLYGIQSTTPFLTPPVSPALPTQRTLMPPVLSLECTLTTPHSNTMKMVPQLTTNSTLPIALAAQTTTQKRKELAKKRLRNSRSSSQVVQVANENSKLSKEIFERAVECNSIVFQEIMPYCPNMARKFPNKTRTPEEQLRRERNTIACRISRRKKLLKKLLEQKQFELSFCKQGI